MALPLKLFFLLPFAGFVAPASAPLRSFFRTEAAITVPDPTTSTTQRPITNEKRMAKTNLTVLWLFALDNSEHGWGRVPIGRLAVEDINNSSTGFFNVNYRLVALERPTQTYGLPDAFNIRKTLGAFVQAIYDYPAQVYMIVGPSFTDEARTLAQLTPIYNLINVAGLATSPFLSDKQSYPLFFRASQSDGDFKFTIAALMEKLNYTQYIGLYLNDPFASDSFSVFQRYLDVRNISAEAIIEFTTDNVSLALVVKRFQKTVARVILLIAQGDEDARAVICTLAREFAVSGKDYVWLFVGFTVPAFPLPKISDKPNCSATELGRAINGSFWLDYGGLDVNDTRMVTGYRPSELASRVHQYIVKNFPKSVNQSVSTVTYREYDAFLAVAVALNNSIRELQKRSPASRIEDFDYSRADIMRVFKEQLLACNVQGATGPIRFQSNGDRFAIIRVLQYQPSARAAANAKNATLRDSWVQVGWQTGGDGSSGPSKLKFTKPLVFGTYNALPPVGVQIRALTVVSSSSFTLQIVLIAAICGGVLPIMLLILFLLRRQHLRTQLRNMHWIVDPRDVTCITNLNHVENDVSPSAKSSPFSSLGNFANSLASLHSDELNYGKSDNTYEMTQNNFHLAYYQTTKVCLFPLANLHSLQKRASLLRTFTTVNPNSNIRTAITALKRANKISSSSQQSQQQKLISELKSNRTLITQVRLARESTHENVARFFGLLFTKSAALEKEDDYKKASVAACSSLHFAVYEWLNKGTLCQLIRAQSVELDFSFKFSILKDVASGLAYLHHKIDFHGRLKSTNVLVDKRFVCKLADYGLEKLQSQHLLVAATDADLLWTAPEILKTLQRLSSEKLSDSSIKHNQKADDTTLAMQHADIFSCAVVACEIFTRQAPYTDWMNLHNVSHRQLLEKVALLSSRQSKRGASRIIDPAAILRLLLVQVEIDQSAENSPPAELIELLTHCTDMNPLHRPTAAHVVDSLRRIMRQYHVSDNIFENLLRRLEQYAHNLETLVHDKTQAFFDEKKRAETLLYNILPRSVADQLKQGKSVEPESFECVTIYFSDIVGFTTLSAESTPIQVIDLLNDLYNMFDSILVNYDVYKVETIGDAYMVVSGLPQRNGDEHARQIALMSQQLVRDITSQFRVRHKPEHRLQLRIGLHSGPCAAGVVGFVMPRYCLFGDTVNTASRMESTGEAMCIHVSQSTQELLAKFFNLTTGDPEFVCEPRGETAVKGKGLMNTYWLQIKEE